MKKSIVILTAILFQFACKAQFSPVQGLTKSPDEAINIAKSKIQKGDKKTIALLSELKTKANEALNAEATSVMDKGVVPPSGNKHDYISQGPYWWPDPSKPDGLPYIRKDGEVNPEIRKFKDHDNMSAMVRNVDALAKTYFFTEEEKYAIKAIEMISVWFINPDTKMNPHLEFGQGIPGRNTGRSIGIIETPGLASIVDAIILLKNSPSWKEKNEQAMQTWMKAYLNWLLTSDHGIKEGIHPNNHGTYYDIQVISLAMYTDQNAIAVDIIEKAKKRRYDAHIVESGEQPHETARTKGYSYSTMNLKGLFQIATMAEKLEIDLWNYKNSSNADLKKALEFLIPYALEEKPLPFKQISPMHADAILPHLWIAYQAYGDELYLDVYQQILDKGENDITPLFY